MNECFHSQPIFLFCVQVRSVNALNIICYTEINIKKTYMHFALHA